MIRSSAIPSRHGRADGASLASLSSPSRPARRAGGVSARAVLALLALASAGAGALAYVSARPGLALALVAASGGLLAWSRLTPRVAAAHDTTRNHSRAPAAGLPGRVPAAGLPGRVPSGNDQRFAAAALSFRKGAYAFAFEQFSRLADEGHPRATAVVLRMLRNGPAAYGIAMPVHDAQLATWRATVASSRTRSLQDQWFIGSASVRQ